MDGKQGIFGNQAGGLWAWDLQRMWPSNSSLEKICVFEQLIHSDSWIACSNTHVVWVHAAYSLLSGRLDILVKHVPNWRVRERIAVFTTFAMCFCYLYCPMSNHIPVTFHSSGCEIWAWNIHWILSVDRGCFQLHLKETCWVNARNCCVDHLKYRRNAKANALAWWIRIQGMTPIGEFPSKKRPCSHKVHIFVLSLRVPCGVGTSARDKACQSWSDSKVLSMWNYSVLI